MRIIGGQLRSRKILSPKDAVTTRPIPDYVKEAVFNLLRGHCEDGPFLDAFAGTGSIGIEAISRGTPRCVFIEKDRRTVELLEQNIQNLGIADSCEVVRADALGPAALNHCPHPAHLIFMDPPYALVRDPESWLRVKLQLERLIEHLDDTGYAILRTPWPFFHETLETTDATVIEDEEDSSTTVEVIHLDEPGADIDLNLEDFFAGRPAGTTKTIHLDVDLTLPNALGPETHIYGTMAVHLYMKKPQ